VEFALDISGLFYYARLRELYFEISCLDCSFFA